MAIVIIVIILLGLLCVLSVISQCMRNARLAHYRDIQLSIEAGPDLDRNNGTGEPKEKGLETRPAGGYTTYVPVIP